MHGKDKIAIIGVGRWGKNLLKTLVSRANIALLCHAGSSETDAWLKRECPTIPVTHDVNEVMQDAEITAVCIATPIQTHAFLVRLALEHGKDVFVEKPICTDPEEADELSHLAQEKGRILMVGYLYLYHESWQKLKEILAHEKIKHVHCTWTKYGSFHEDGIWNLLVHEVALVSDILGTPKSTHIEPIASVLGVHDVFTYIIDYPGGEKATGIVNRISSLPNHSVTITTQTNVYIWEGNRVLKIEKEKEPTLLFETQTLPLDRECDAFLSALQNRSNPLTGGEMATLITKVIAGAFPPTH